MCISQPVGRNATANRDNTTTVQVLLNLNLDKLIGIPPYLRTALLGRAPSAPLKSFSGGSLG